MTHETFQEMLLELAYGELSGREARRIEAHAASCEACRAELARIRETRRAMSALSDEPAPERGENVLLAAARERSRSRRPSRGLPRWLFAGSIAAVSAAAVVAISYRILEMRPGPLGRSDRDALLGEARPAPAVAAAPQGAAPAPGSAPGEEAEKHRASELEAKERRGSGLLGVEVPAPVPGAPGRTAGAEEGAGGKAAPTPPSKAKRAPAGEPSRFAEPPAGYEERAAPESFALRHDRAAPAAPPEPPAAAGRAEKREAPAAGAASGAPLDAAPEEAAPRAFAEQEAAPAAPRSRSAPAPAAPAVRGPAPSMAAPRPVPPAADAVHRYEALRAEGRLSAEIRTFPGCAGEAWRKVERDPEGRVVAYVREGTIGGARFRAEAIYGEDGRLARARALPLGGGAAPDAGVLVPGDAASAGIDAPPRCGR